VAQARLRALEQARERVGRAALARASPPPADSGAASAPALRSLRLGVAALERALL
jgi:hypothetical protein